MKIAVAADGQYVSGHFGHCEGFAIFTTRQEVIEKREFVQNPGHQPGFLPNFLGNLGVNVVISGGMGGNAVQMFQEKGIEVVTGASGAAEQAVSAYISGTLKSSGSVCGEHQHAGSCGNH